MDHRESTIFRLRVLAGIFLAIMAIFLGVLYNTQVNDYDEYYASSIRTIARPEEVDAARGDITDRNGKVMVSSRPSYSLTFDASELEDGASFETVTCAVYVPVAQQDSALLIVTVTGTSRLPLWSPIEERSTVQKTESPVRRDTCAAVPTTRTCRLAVERSAVLPITTGMGTMVKLAEGASVAHL